MKMSITSFKRIFFKQAVALCILLATTMLISACVEPPEENATASTSSNTSAPAKNEPEKTTDQTAMNKQLLEKVSACNDLIELYTCLAEARSAECEVNPATQTAINEKWSAFLAASPAPIPLCPEADLVYHRFKKPASDNERHTLSMLFEVNKDFNKKYLMSMYGYVDPSHVNHLPENLRKAGYAVWGFTPSPATTQWKEKAIKVNGKSYMLINRGVVAEDIPYNIKILLYWNDENGKMAGRYGSQIDLGWCYDMGN